MTIKGLKFCSVISFLLEAAAVLATFAHPNHIVYLCSWGFTLLPPTCNSKSFWYKSKECQSEAEYDDFAMEFLNLISTSQVLVSQPVLLLVWRGLSERV
ncbi:hypothetical protein CGT85_02170 [Vibrio cholerae]|nr:hypothetical protein CGT85_02170 [Vibrio cholerae]